MRYRAAILILVLVGLISSSVWILCHIPQHTKTIQLSLGTKTYHAVLARTPVEQEKGLSDRGPLASDEAMLFLFPTSMVQHFWMHDMRFNIDIIWIDSQLHVIGAVENASSARVDQETIYSSPAPVRYVLEVPAGDYQATGRPQTLVVDDISNVR